MTVDEKNIERDVIDLDDYRSAESTVNLSEEAVAVKESMRFANEGFQKLDPVEADAVIRSIEQSQSIENSVTNALVIGQHYQGPIPPPELLCDYEKVLPGAADRIMTMAENEANARHEGDMYIKQIYEKGERRGQIIAGILVLGYFVLIGFIALSERPVETAILTGVGIAAIVGHIVRGRMGSQKSNK